MARLQRTLGIGSDQAVFTDAQLQDNSDWAGGDFALTVVLCLEQLLGDAAKLHALSAGNTSESPQQVFDHLVTLLRYWQNKAGVGGSLIGGSIGLGIDQPLED